MPHSFPLTRRNLLQCATLTTALPALSAPATTPHRVTSLRCEALIDPISEDGGIVRVHLRPLLAAHLPVEPLLEAFVRTSQEFPGSIEKLREYLQEALRLKGDDVLPFSVRQITGTFHDRERAGFPAVHHSEEYRNAYHPAYRVTALAFLPPEWTGENG